MQLRILIFTNSPFPLPTPSPQTRLPLCNQDQLGTRRFRRELTYTSCGRYISLAMFIRQYLKTMSEKLFTGSGMCFMVFRISDRMEECQTLSMQRSIPRKRALTRTTTVSNCHDIIPRSSCATYERLLERITLTSFATGTAMATSQNLRKKLFSDMDGTSQ